MVIAKAHNAQGGEGVFTGLILSFSNAIEVSFPNHEAPNVRIEEVEIGIEWLKRALKHCLGRNGAALHLSADLELGKYWNAPGKRTDFSHAGMDEVSGQRIASFEPTQ